MKKIQKIKSKSKYLKKKKKKNEPKTVYNFNTINENEIDILVKQYAEKHKEPLTSYTIFHRQFCYKKISYSNSNGQNAYGLKRKEKQEIKLTLCFWRMFLFIVKYFLI